MRFVAFLTIFPVLFSLAINNLQTTTSTSLPLELLDKKFSVSTTTSLGHQKRLLEKLGSLNDDITTTFTSSSSFSVNTSASSDSDAARLATILAVMNDFTKDSAKYSSVNAELFNKYKSYNETFYTLTQSKFLDKIMAYSMRSILLNLFTELPEPQQQSLQPSITSYYGELYGLVQADVDPVSPTLTTTWNTQVTGTTGYYSDFYQLAIGKAMQNDMNAFGHYYNELNTTISNHTVFSKLQQYNRQLANADIPSAVNSYLNKIASLIDYLPQDWKNRILESAKNIYYASYATMNGGICIADNCIPSSIRPNTKINTDPITVTSGTPQVVAAFFPFVVSYETVMSTEGSENITTVTASTTTLSHEITITDATTTRNLIASTGTVSSNVQAAITCAVDALVHNYYKNTTEFDQYIKNTANNSEFISEYQNILDEFKTEDIFGNNDSWNKVLARFYNFIFKLPDERRFEIIDVLGFCYLFQYTAPSTSTLYMTDYKSGDGAFFRSIFKFGDAKSVYIEFTPVTLSESVVMQAFLTSYDSTDTPPPIFPTTVAGYGDTVTAAPGLANVELDVNLHAGGNTMFNIGLLQGLLYTF